MKKSIIYTLAQYAVLQDERLRDAEKMEVLLELEKKRSMEEYLEIKEEEEKNAENGK